MAFMQSAPEETPVPPEEAEEEELEDLPEVEKESDPLRHARIQRSVDGKVFKGQVDDIECGRITQERLYRIKYEDGDLEHMTADQVKGALVSEEPDARTPAAAAEEAPEEAEAEEAEGEETGGDVQKRPAGRGRGAGRGGGRGVARDIAKRPAAAAAPKAKGKAKAKAMSKKPAGR